MRRKRWIYWCLIGDQCVLALTAADVGYLGLVAVSVLDLATGAWTERALPLPFAAGIRLGRDFAFHRFGLHLTMRDESATTHLSAAFKGVSAEVLVHHAGHESLTAVVGARRTTKAVGLPTEGEIRVGTHTYTFDAHRSASSSVTIPWE